MIDLSKRAPMPWRRGLTWDDQGALEGRRELTTFSITSGSPRGDLDQRTIARYRAKRETPRPDLGPGGMHVYEDPAPDWVWKLAQDVLEHTEHENDHGKAVLNAALMWCEAGDAVARSERLRDPGPVAPSRNRFFDTLYVRNVMTFLEEAWKHPEYLPKR